MCTLPIPLKIIEVGIECYRQADNQELHDEKDRREAIEHLKQAERWPLRLDKLWRRAGSLVHGYFAGVIE
jgi:hypothetical protein